MNFYTEKRLEIFQNVNRESVLLANDYVIQFYDQKRMNYTEREIYTLFYITVKDINKD